MPTKLQRFQQAGHLHFVTFSCHDRRPYLSSPEAKGLFEQALERMRVRYDFLVVAYVVMPEHVHLLLSEPRKGNLATAIQAIKLSVSVRRKERPFWLQRYHDFNVFTEKKLIEKHRYTHRNPVARGLVQKPNECAWSSFCHWWSGEIGTVEIESPYTVRRRGGLRTSLDPDTGRVQSHVSEARRGGTRSKPASKDLVRTSFPTALREQAIVIGNGSSPGDMPGAASLHDTE